MAKGNIFVISGPSGAGKGKIVERLITKYPDVHKSVSVTTRALRGDERLGYDYDRISDEEYDRLIAEDKFLEHAQVQTDRYGTIRERVEKEINNGYHIILEIDVQGCEQALKVYPDLTSIFICPPDAETLEKRLRGRKSEKENNVRVRLGNAPRELEKGRNYDYIVVNYDWNVVENALDIAVDQVYSIIKTKELTPAYCAEFIDGLAKSMKERGF